MADRSLRSTRGYRLRPLRRRRPKRSFTRVAPLSAPDPDPEGITAHSRSVEDLRDDTTGSLLFSGRIPEGSHASASDDPYGGQEFPAIMRTAACDRLGVDRSLLRLLGHYTRMADSTPSVREKVEAIFRELAGDRAATLDATSLPAGITSTITADLAAEDADEISFHLTDWSW